MQKFISIDYIKIAIANAWGFDKLSFDERIDYVHENLTSKYNDLDLIEAAKEIIVSGAVESPNMFLKSVQAYIDHGNKNPSGFWMSLDATASG